MYQSGNRNSVKCAEDMLRDAEKNLRRAKLRRELEMKPRKKAKTLGIVLVVAVMVGSFAAGILVHPGLLFAGLAILVTGGVSVWAAHGIEDEVRPTEKELLELKFKVEDAKEELAEAYMEAK